MFKKKVFNFFFFAHKLLVFPGLVSEPENKMAEASRRRHGQGEKTSER